VEVWRPLAALLQENFHVTSFDLRGHGQTPLNSDNPEQYWRDIGSVIKALKLDHPVLAGHSTGGYAITAFAAAGGDCSALFVLDGFVLDPRSTPDEAHAWSLTEEKLRQMFRYGWVAEKLELEKYVEEVCRNAPSDWLNAGIPPDLISLFTRRTFLFKGEKWCRRPTLEEIRIVGYPDKNARIYPSIDIYNLIETPLVFIHASKGLYANRVEDLKNIVSQRNNRFFYQCDCGHNLCMLKAFEIAEIIRNKSSF
jgi:pimeloyl-ACP methyl ester carboxylesterase